jgi:hypothetical protein
MIPVIFTFLIIGSELLEIILFGNSPKMVSTFGIEH